MIKRDPHLGQLRKESLKATPLSFKRRRCNLIVCDIAIGFNVGQYEGRMLEGKGYLRGRHIGMSANYMRVGCTRTESNIGNQINVWYDLKQAMR
jgi:hypothetical protein